MKDTKIAKLSFVIPAMNEEKTISSLYSGIKRNVDILGLEHEVIFVDDGSSDQTWSEMLKIAEIYKNVKAIKLRTNLGKARALSAGFEQATGQLIFTMDADLQDDPNEISRFVSKIEEGNDIVTGYKEKRHDPWHKVIPSRVFNFILSTLVNVKLHDHNCGFKCYKSEVIKERKLYGDMHRMIPSLASIDGFKTAEIVVTHHPRLHGISKYGVKRIFRGSMDMLTVYFLKNFRERPLHFIGLFSAALCTVGSAFLISTFIYEDYIVYPLLAGMCFVSATLLMAVGFLAELKVANEFNDYKQFCISDAVNLVREKYDISKIPQEDPLNTAKEVLVVDDDATLRKLLTYHLKNAGYVVHEASNGVEAVQKYNQKIGLIFMDMMMPEMDGLEAVKLLLEKNRNLKIAMISASGQVSKAVQALKVGAFDYISKPFEPEELLSTATAAFKRNEPNSVQVLH